MAAMETKDKLNLKKTFGCLGAVIGVIILIIGCRWNAERFIWSLVFTALLGVIFGYFPYLLYKVGKDSAVMVKETAKGANDWIHDRKTKKDEKKK